MFLPEPPQGWKNLDKEPWLMLSEDSEFDGMYWIIDTYGGNLHATDTLEGGCIEIIDSCFLPHFYTSQDQQLILTRGKGYWLRLRDHVKL